MLVRGQTTEDRIAQIAQGFGQGFQNFQGQQDRQRAISLQDEARKRQEALQALEIEARLADTTGRDTIGSGLGSKILKGEAYDPSMVSGLGLSRKAVREEALLAKQAESDNLNKLLKVKQLEELSKPFEQTKDYQKLKATEDLRAKSRKPIQTEDQKLAYKQQEKLATGNAGLYGVKSAMDEALKILSDASVSEDQKIKTGQGLFKLLNSAEGSDAVGAEEAKRIGSYLEFNLANVTQPGAFFGRDVKGFTDQVKNYSKLLGDRIVKNEQGINQLKGGGSLSDLVSQPVSGQMAAPVRVAPEQVKAIKQMSDEDLLKFIQGN